MPLSQYKKKELYKHVDSFELADPGLFEDAVITENLSICFEGWPAAASLYYYS